MDGWMVGYDSAKTWGGIIFTLSNNIHDGATVVYLYFLFFLGETTAKQEKQG